MSLNKKEIEKKVIEILARRMLRNEKNKGIRRRNRIAY